MCDWKTRLLPRGVWRFKAIYQLHGERVGQWSDVVSMAVAA